MPADAQPSVGVKGCLHGGAAVALQLRDSSAAAERQPPRIYTRGDFLGLSTFPTRGTQENLYWISSPGHLDARQNGYGDVLTRSVATVARLYAAVARPRDSV